MFQWVERTVPRAQYENSENQHSTRYLAQSQTERAIVRQWAYSHYCQNSSTNFQNCHINRSQRTLFYFFFGTSMRTMQNVGVLFTYSKYIISDTKELVQNIEMITGVQVGSCAVQSFIEHFITYPPLCIYSLLISLIELLISFIFYIHTSNQIHIILTYRQVTRVGIQCNP